MRKKFRIWSGYPRHLRCANKGTFYRQDFDTKRFEVFCGNCLKSIATVGAEEVPAALNAWPVRVEEALREHIGPR